MEKKPIILRVAFLLNALLMFLPFIFYYIFTSKNLQVDGLEPIHMIYTGIGYILSFALMVTSILRRNLIAFRSVFVLVILISLTNKGIYRDGVCGSILIAFSSQKNNNIFNL